MEIETNWKFYLESPPAWEAMLAEIERAQKTIRLEQFIMETDTIGTRFLEALKRKAKEGVKVKVLLDAAGSLAFYTSSLWKNTSEPNLSIVFFNSLIPGALGRHTSWYFRDHRKLLVIDSRVAFTGGICLGDEMKSWRDTHVRIEGPIIKQMEWLFDRMLSRAKKINPKSEKNPPASGDGFEYVTSVPLPRRRFLYYRVTDAIRSAQESIYITTPYFVPDRRVVRILKLAASRGVDVRILLPKNSDHPLVDFAARSFFSAFLRSGARIYQYTDRMIHAKTITIDKDWSTVGSLNFDNVSLRYNFEGNIISTNKQFASDLRSQFVVDLHNAKEVIFSEWETRSFALKVLEFVGRLLSTLL